MFLVDTDVISELRKGSRANVGVRTFFAQRREDEAPLYLSVVTIGELRRGVEKIRQRGDWVQADQIEAWLLGLCADYSEAILPFDADMAHAWGRLRVPHPENALDKQIAATALLHDLAVVTRNEAHFAQTGVRLVNPFSG